MKKRKEGFSLIEMLVVIGIIAILSGALMVGFGRVTQTAQRAKAQEAVSNAATALSLFYQKNQSWGETLRTAASSGRPQMNADVAKILAWGKPKLTDSQGQNYLGINFEGSGEGIKLLGTDRWGIVDPWAAAVLKKNKDAGLGASVPSGGTIQDHLLYFGIDDDEDGITVVNLEGGAKRIRATAVVWCAGRDGKLAAIAQIGRSDDVYSWQRGQESRK